MSSPVFDAGCRRCPRLAKYLDQSRRDYPEFYSAPVPPFGDPAARLLVVGLAPGLKGANATGRAFTGDHAGGILYRMLHRFGFASAPESLSVDDGLQLRDCRISNAVKCVPPQNKPVGAEINECNRFLAADIATLPEDGMVLALGGIAHNAVLKALGLRLSAWRFGHAAEHALPDGPLLLDSYHCSRYNTQTRRLTEPMFAAVFARACEILAGKQRA